MFKTHRTFELTNGVKNNSIAVVITGTETCVLYHNTTVFRHVHKTNKVYLNDGGWNTISTKIVINRALELTRGFGSYCIERKSKTNYVKSCYLKAPIELAYINKPLTAKPYSATFNSEVA